MISEHQTIERTIIMKKFALALLAVAFSCGMLQAQDAAPAPEAPAPCVKKCCPKKSCCPGKKCCDKQDCCKPGTPCPDASCACPRKEGCPKAKCCPKKAECPKKG